MSAVLQLDAPLRAQRRPLPLWRALPPSEQGLGGLAYGGAPGEARIVAPVLSEGGPQVDAWLSEGPFTDGRCGRVRWRHNGRWLFGSVELDEAVEGVGLESLAQRAYGDIFATLRETGCSHLQRLWNYLPRINVDGGGLERYRQFNSGRQQAFLAAGQAAFEGAPAACAIGTAEGPFSVHFLAGTDAPLPIENPRQVPAYHYPRTYGPRSPTFSRAALVPVSTGEVALLISGTASIVGHASVHLGDVTAQTRETLTNLQAVIEAAQARTSARFALPDMSCTIYVRHAADAPVILQAFEAAVGAGSPAAREAVVLQADICRAELLVEIEAHGVARGKVLA